MSPPMTTQDYTRRVFTDSEESRRSALLSDLVDENCFGCKETGYGEERSWQPAERCPVHGANPDAFWRMLNQKLDAVAPGRWVA